MQDEADKHNMKLAREYIRGVRHEDGILQRSKQDYLVLPSEEQYLAERWARKILTVVELINKSGLIGKLKFRLR